MDLVSPRDLAQIYAPKMPNYTRNVLEKRAAKLKKDAIRFATFLEKGSQLDPDAAASLTRTDDFVSLWQDSSPGRRAQMMESLKTLRESAWGSRLLQGNITSVSGDFDNYDQFQTIQSGVGGRYAKEGYENIGILSEEGLGKAQAMFNNELKDDKIKFITELSDKKELGSWLQKNPQNMESVKDLITLNPDKFKDSSSPIISALASDLPSDGIDSAVSDSVRENKKLEYIKRLARRKSLAMDLSSSNPERRNSVTDFVRANSGLLADIRSPALSLILSGRSEERVGQTATALDVLASMQDGTFTGKFKRLNPSGRESLLENISRFPEIKMPPLVKERAQQVMLKDQGIEVDSFGLPRLRRNDFSSSDEYWGALEGRRRKQQILKKQRVDRALAERRNKATPRAQRGRDAARDAARRQLEEEITLRVNRGQNALPIFDRFAKGFIPNFSPKGQSAIVNEIIANESVGQRGVRPQDVGFVKLNAGQGKGFSDGTMVQGGRHGESLVQTNLGDFIIPAKAQQGEYVNRLKQQSAAAGMNGLPGAIMQHAPNSQGFIPNLQNASVGINNVAEMQSLVERFEGTATQIANTINEGSMKISHAVDLRGKVEGLDQKTLVDALENAMVDTAATESTKQISKAFNDTNLNSEVAPPPTNIPRFNRPGNE